MDPSESYDCTCVSSHHTLAIYRISMTGHGPFMCIRPGVLSVQALKTRLGSEERAKEGKPMVTRVQEGRTNEEQYQGRSDKTLPGEGPMSVKCILKAYDGGTFLDAQQATRDNHGQMGEDSSEWIEGRWDRAARVQMLGMQR